MAKLNIKTGDNVLVITGKNKGLISVVSSTSPKDGTICVQNANVQTKHAKARRANEKSELRKIEGFMQASNVMIVCPTCNKATRIAKKEIEGKMIRVCKKCGASLESDKKVSKVTKTTTKSTKTASKISAKSPAKSTVKKQASKSTTSRTVARGDK